MTTLHTRWQLLCKHLSLPQKTAETFNSLQSAYSEPGRFYHTLVHLEDCLIQLDTCRATAPNPHDIELALWFHDAIYDTHAADNERQSADWARQFLTQNGADTKCINRVDKLIMATCHDALPQDETECYLIDIDLSILGRTPDAFAAYEAQVRQEYVWVPEKEFCQRRQAILEAFLQRSQIYQTAHFYKHYEMSARRNLANSIEHLRQAV
ncbi:MAG: N-methyl-D-aspartate receptor NMDAR2C subunit [Pseudomonadota bacterium]